LFIASVTSLLIPVTWGGLQFSWEAGTRWYFQGVNGQSQLTLQEFDLNQDYVTDQDWARSEARGDPGMPPLAARKAPESRDQESSSKQNGS
jgi:hypothetical protein